MRKIYILPNLITTANIVCGFLAMVHAYQGDFTRACWFIVIGAICDSLDGRVARLAKATSQFGVQYDSLSDLTSFGVAPAMMMFMYALQNLGRFGISVAAFYCVCAALRLARFNVGAEEVADPEVPISARKKIRKGYFQGLPSPASAGLVVSTILVQQEFSLLTPTALAWCIAALCALLAGLMISSIPFPSFKEANWRARGKSWILLIPLVMILSVIQAPELTLFVIGYIYLFLGMGWAFYLHGVRDKKHAAMNGVQRAV
jgi:CDP-diacylglycerol--serine O-phosphatidyltransferase